MNLILLDDPSPTVHLAVDDPRAIHLRRVLRVRTGSCVDVGVPMGPRGRAEVVADDGGRLTLACHWLDGDQPEEPAVHLLLGLIRPIEGRRLLEDVAAAGVAAVHGFPAERTEAGYASAGAWQPAEAAAALRRGAAQGFTTWVPPFHRHASLAAALAAVAGDGRRVVLDVYEAATPLLPTAGHSAPVLLAIGPERGWSAAERAQFRSADWQFHHLGPRVLRTAHAAHAALALLAAQAGQRSHLEVIRPLREATSPP